MSSAPSLEPRFLMPEGWREHGFKTASGHSIRYGSVYPSKSVTPFPKALIVALEGRTEFIEKYYETAHDMVARGYAFWVMDWVGQGKSGRLLKDRHRDHSMGFEGHIEDLHKFIMDYIKPAAVHPDRGRIPLVMLAQSMGGNIGLRYVAKYPKIFDAACFCTPMTGMKALKSWAPMTAELLLTLLYPLHSQYIRGGKQWTAGFREADENNFFSSDAKRRAVHNIWCAHDHDLQIGDVTYGWVYQALKSCNAIERAGVLENIPIPTLFILAENEQLVDNDTTRAAAARIKGSKVMEIAGSCHEILMERDALRNQLFNAFDSLISDNKIATLENLKPF